MKRNTNIEDWEKVIDDHFFPEPSDLVIDKGELKSFIKSLISQAVQEERQKTLEEVGKIKIPISLWKHDIKIIKWWDKAKQKVLDKLSNKGK